MNAVRDFFTNYLLISAIVAWFIAQITKVFTGMFKERKFSLTVLLFSNGGMPSSHSASVCALATASALQFGFNSFECAITFVMAIVVMIDASGVRYETGKQAQVINKITKELFSGRPDEMDAALKELVGHTPFQVMVGAIVGVGVAIAFWFIMH